MLELIIKDFLDISTFFPRIFICASIAYLLILLLLIHLFKIKEIPFHKHAINLSFIFYCFTVLYITIFSRSPGDYKTPEFSFFISWHYSMQTKAFIIENFLMLAPLGAYFTYYLPKRCALITSTLGCLFVSVTIELIQYSHNLGYFQLDDIIANVIGGFIGTLFVIFFYITKPSRPNA